MPNTVTRIARSLHAWAGMVLSLLMIVLSLSGSLLVWKEDYLRLTIPGARAGLDTAPASLARLAEAAERHHGAGNIRTLVFGTEEFGLTRVYLDGDRHAWLAPDGTPVAEWTGTARPEEWLFDLHHHLLAGHTGEIISGIAGLSMAVLIVCGLIAYWPTHKAFSLGFSLRSLKRPHLLLTHRNLGVVLAVPALALMVTGGAMVFSQQARAITGLFDGTRTEQATKEQPLAAPVEGWEDVFTAAETEFPGAGIRIASFPSAERPSAALRLKQPGEWHPNGRSTVTVAPTGASHLIRADAQAFGPGLRLNNAFYPVHSARTDSLLWKLVVFLTGLGLTALGMLGLAAFLQRSELARLFSRLPVRA